MEINRLLEDRIHGNTMFPLKVYMVDDLDGDVIFNCHWHPEIEFIYMETGAAIIQIGSALFTLHEGEAIFIPSGQLHAAYPVEDQPFKLHAIVFHVSFISSFSYDTIQSKYIDLLKDSSSSLPTLIQMSTKWGNHVLKSLSTIIDQYQRKEPLYELTIKAQLFLLLAELIKANPLKSNTGESNESVKINRVKKVLQYIDDHISEKLTIQDLSSIVQMSEGHFSRFFKSFLRMTPIEYINTVRVNKAARLLKETDKQIIEISMEVGFDNPSYFIKTFKRLKKYTPSAFRKSF